MKVLSIEEFKDKVFNFEQSKDWVFNGTKPTIIDFYADWCGPCRALSPVLDELQQKYGEKIDIFKVDTEATPELAALFGVRGIPALLFIPLEGEPAMSSGFMPLESFERALHELFGIQIQ